MTGASDPKSAKEYCARAVDYHNAGRYAEAIADYTRAIELEPGNALYHQQRGVSYHAAGRYAEAIADKTRAIELKPGNATYFHERGKSYHQARRYAEAIADKTRAIELEPGNASYYDSRSVSHHAAGHYAEAIQDDTRAIELEPLNPKFYESRAITYRAAERAAEAESDEKWAKELLRLEQAGQMPVMPPSQTASQPVSVVPAPPAAHDHIRLYDLLNSEAFSLDDLEDLCFRLDVDWDGLDGSTKPKKIRALLQYFRGRGRLTDLKSAAQKMRPHLDWGT